MLTLITGQPGAGKTLYMITAAKEEAEKSNRPVFFAGINGLDAERLGWIELDDKKEWHKVPDGSIVVIDEAQEMWRTRGVGSQVPEYVSAMETHRHRGLDVFATTQHPMMLDSNIRRLCGRHLHVMRTFGLNKATIHEWGTVKPEPDKTRTDSIRHDFIYPKQNFALYKSAEIHTHKRRIPPRVFFLIALPVILAALAWAAYVTLRPYTTGENLKPANPLPTNVQVTTAGNRPGGKADTPAQYADKYNPRIAGLAYTAPAYDQVTEPVRAPYPAAAVLIHGKCRAYSQQGTRLEVPDDLCRTIVKDGFFVSWQDEESKPSRTTQEPSKQADPYQPPSGGTIAAPAPQTLTPAPKPDGGGPSTNPRYL